MTTPPDALAPGAARLRAALFATPDLTAYAIVDGAARLDLATQLHDHPAPHTCLFIGALEPELAATAPWLIALEPGAAITDILLRGWGGAQGVFALSRLGLTEMRRKLRSLTMVGLPDGRNVFFRFYDPRVMAATAPLLNEAQRTEFFGRGGIEAFLFEGPEGGALRFLPDGAGPAPLAEG